ncbi:GntR family transcriptional regulator [Pseudogracilibacillus sp. SO30301A]|uniref:GntR family transcriptional regulator n=1 Tax=Pseudogracilibacillus sp. SO30301A TaxID=3098291 RepID=UPI00300E5263
MNYPGTTRLSAKDYAYFEIKQKILEGELAPSQSIVEEELSSQLGISRTPLRGALQQLEFENLVERKSNGRLKVPSISIQEVEEIFTVRMKLEEIAVEQATDNATEDDIHNLSNIVYMIKKTYGDGRIEDILYYGAQFHNYLYDLSGNRTVSHILTQLNDQIHRYRRLVPVQNVDRNKESGEEHEIILDRIAQKDSQGAKAVMQEHIQNSLEAAIHAIKAFKKQF